MKLTKEEITKLEIPQETKDGILVLFADIETQQKEVDSIRAKMPKDSQKIVESVDYDKFVAATTELAKLKEEMAAKLNEDGGEDGESILSAFASFFR